jgi:hypothetical protein
MTSSSTRQWWLLITLALLIVCVWPPVDDKSLAMKFVNWAVDPLDRLPLLPPQFALGEGDDPEVVARHDMLVQQYDALYLKEGWTRKRLELKAARDPFNASTERQLFTGAGVLVALLAWRWGTQRTRDRNQ